jgi:carboxypeptidase C (cathepsin A)
MGGARSTTSKAWRRSAAALILVLARMAHAEPAPVITQHRILIGARPLAYSAEAGRIAIRDVATGAPLGYMFYVAYRAAPRPGQVRPITFLWNGGPGLPAASTEFEGFGPRRIEAGQMVDNADTLLTDSDLVFVDPIGTGFSRAVDTSAQEAFTSIVGDAAAAAEFVHAWLLKHGDEDRPIVLSGQSYAAGRAGSAAYALLKRGFKVRGLALVSNSQGLPPYPDQERIAAAVHVGDYAVAALYYRKLPPSLGTTPEAVRASAERWAHEVYLPALDRIDRLSDREREAVAVELARRIGLPPAEVDRNTLIVTQGHFLGTLVPGKLPYYSDYRILEPHRTPPLDLGVRFIRHDLAYPSDLPYLGVEPVEQGFAPDGVYPKSVNETWLHATTYGATRAQVDAAEKEWEKKELIGMAQFGPDLPGAAAAVALSPSLKVLVAHAAYDPLGGCSIDAERARHLVEPFAHAIRFRCYMAGHAIYRDAPARHLFADDLRTLAREAAGAAP